MEPIGSIHLVCHRMLIVYESSVCAACDTVVLYGVAKICSQRYMVTSSNLVGLGTSSLTTLAFRLLNATVLNTKLLTITVMGVDCLLRGSLKRASQKTFPTLGGGNVLQCFKVGLYQILMPLAIESSLVLMGLRFLTRFCRGHGIFLSSMHGSYILQVFPFVIDV